jgi:hypothetical protein
MTNHLLSTANDKSTKQPITRGATDSTAGERKMSIENPLSPKTKRHSQLVGRSVVYQQAHTPVSKKLN